MVARNEIQACTHGHFIFGTWVGEALLDLKHVILMKYLENMNFFFKAVMFQDKEGREAESDAQLIFYLFRNLHISCLSQVNANVEGSLQPVSYPNSSPYTCSATFPQPVA